MEIKHITWKKLSRNETKDFDQLYQIHETAWLWKLIQVFNKSNQITGVSITIQTVKKPKKAIDVHTLLCSWEEMPKDGFGRIISQKMTKENTLKINGKGL